MATGNKNWIAGAVKKPGALHRELGVKSGSKIPATKLASAKKGNYGALAKKRAVLAATLKKLSK